MKARTNGEGRIYRPKYRDANGEIKEVSVWYIQYTDPRRPHGKQQVRESSKSEDKRVAVKRLRERLADIAKGRPAGPDVEKTTLGQLAEMIRTDYRNNGRRSLGRIEECLTHLVGTDEVAGFFGREHRAVYVTEDRVAAYIEHRKGEGAKNATINRELACLKRMFRLGMKSRRVAYRPEITMLEENNVRTGFFEPEDFRQVVAQLPADLQPVAEVAYITGWRVASEIITRQWKHVDFGPQRWECLCAEPNGRAVVRTTDTCDACGRFRPGWLRLEPGETKNRKGRQFPLTPELRRVLEGQRRRTSALEQVQDRIIADVFWRAKGPGVREDGTPVGAFYKAWQSACERAGVPGRLRHDFRRTAVRNLERAAVPRSTAMAMVGHLTESIYRRYAITDEAMLNEGALKLAALHQAQATQVATSSRVTQFRKKAAAR